MTPTDCNKNRCKASGRKDWYEKFVRFSGISEWKSDLCWMGRHQKWQEIEVCLTIRKEDGSILDVQVSRVKRADVGQVIYQDASFRQIWSYIFHIRAG